MSVTLDTLKTSQSGVIIQVNGGGAVRRRLLDIGLTCGAFVYVIKIAPFGDPMMIFLRQYRLGIRKAEAKNIIVHKLQLRVNKAIRDTPHKAFIFR